MSSITILAMIGETGEPIEVPNFCLYILLLKLKNVESKTFFNAFIYKFRQWDFCAFMDLFPSISHAI